MYSVNCGAVLYTILYSREFKTETRQGCVGDSHEWVRVRMYCLYTIHCTVPCRTWFGFVLAWDLYECDDGMGNTIYDPGRPYGALEWKYWKSCPVCKGEGLEFPSLFFFFSSLVLLLSFSLARWIWRVLQGLVRGSEINDMGMEPCDSVSGHPGRGEV